MGAGRTYRFLHICTNLERTYPSPLLKTFLCHEAQEPESQGETPLAALLRYVPLSVIASYIQAPREPPEGAELTPGRGLSQVRRPTWEP